MSECKTIAIVNEKGGVGKSSVCMNLGVGLARAGKRVLAIDIDPQASLSKIMGYDNPPYTLYDILQKHMVQGNTIVPKQGILTHHEGVDLLPSDKRLSQTALVMVGIMGRENLLKRHISYLKDDYDYIVIDCLPTLGLLTTNALTAADSVLIPMEADFLSVKGLEGLLSTIQNVRYELNPKLSIEGILVNKMDGRSNFSRDMLLRIQRDIGKSIPVFPIPIPMSVRVKEAGAQGESIFAFDPKGLAAQAFDMLTKEVLSHSQNQKYSRKHSHQSAR